jgi:predicted GIY-YIG superfamily endonuclease
MRKLCHSGKVFVIPGKRPGIHGYFSAGIEERLVHVELYNYVNDALRREKQLKGWHF